MDSNAPRHRERDLLELIDIMKTHRLTHLKVGAVELVMDVTGFPHPADPVETKEPEPSEAEWTFMSAEGPPPSEEDALALIPTHLLPHIPRKVE